MMCNNSHQQFTTLHFLHPFITLSFLFTQGASRRIITMEWDKFWAENKRVLEESSARYMGVACQDMVTFTVTNLPSQDITSVSVQVHPQKPEFGHRVMRQYHQVTP